MKTEQVEDHPRVCGENGLNSISLPRSSGSPPRVRGKQIWLVVKMLSNRITPACAGKTRLSRLYYSYPRDHPRVCGENEC